MFSRILKVGVLSGCLLVAGQASASDRSVVVPVLAGAAVGAVLVAVLGDSSDDRHGHHGRPHHRPPAYKPHGHPPRPHPHAMRHGPHHRPPVLAGHHHGFHGHRGGRY